MNYSNLSKEEKMKMAEDYSLILINEEAKLQDEIIKELSATFFLTKEDALEAFKNSYKNHKEEFRKSKKQKITQAFIILIVSVITACFYFYIANQRGLELFSILGLLFAISVFILSSLINDYFFEDLTLKYPWIKSLKRNLFIEFLPLLLLFFIIFGYLNIWGGELKKGDTTTRQFILDKDIEYIYTGGKSTDRYYKFIFRGIKKEFRFNFGSYKYANDKFRISNIKIGDTLYVSLLNKKLANIDNETLFDKYNSIVNLNINGSDIIDYNIQKNGVEKERRISFWIVSLLLVLDIYFSSKLIKKARQNI